ncbi:MAG: tetratricopeptide repeat protein [Gammaproteobacteria bacterium]|nr:tetratricopeptide repeat protein [Gammaproteobacteria bacterium]
MRRRGRRMNLEAALQLALQHQQAGRLPQAQALYQQILHEHPEQPQALHLLGLLARSAGRPDLAADLLGKAVRAEPGLPDHHYKLGITRAMQEDLDAAAGHFRQALALQPHNVPARYNLGLALYKLDRLEDAAAVFRDVCARAPRLPEAHLMLGLALHRLARPEPAEDAFKQALRLRPDYAEAHNNLANLYLDQNRLEPAEQAARAAIALLPGFAVAHYNLGLACLRLGRLDCALDSFQDALRLNPDYADACINLGVTLTYLGRGREALERFETGVRLAPGHAAGHSARLFSMLYLATTTPAGMLAAQRQFAAQCEAPLRHSWRAHENTCDSGRRLKVGYVSADFRRHSVAHFIEPVLAGHDRSHYEVYCYYNHTVRDDTTARIAACADHWIPCRGLSDQELSGRIRRDGIDILVDLAGHSVDNRLMAFARRPAPVQVTWLGSPATTGLDAMDYRLCTADTDPPGQEAFHSEALYRLPRTLWCYRPAQQRTAVTGAARPAAGTGAVTFGSLNNIAKVSEESMAAWMEILRALPAARLVMTQVPTGAARHAISARFTAGGVASQRLELHGKLPGAQYFNLIEGIDIALDPFPYTGTTTTCETLWTGIPVVTLIGQTSVARSGYALLKTVGLEELAAADTEDYVRLAVELAHDPDRLARLRRELPARFDASPLRDEAAFTRDLEAAYRDMWQRWCAAGAGA